MEADEKAKPNKDENKNTSTTDEPENPVDGVFVVELDGLKSTRIAFGEGEYKNLAFNKDGTQLAFLTNKDDYQTKTASWSIVGPPKAPTRS